MGVGERFRGWRRQPARVGVVIALLATFGTIMTTASLGAAWHGAGKPDGPGGLGSTTAAARAAETPVELPLTVRQTAATTFTVPGALPQLPWPTDGEAAIEVEGLGLLGTSGAVSSPVPIASITKTMTAYLILEDHPLAAGQDGPTITVTRAEAETYVKESDTGDSLVPVRAGEQISERDALYALMLASADNFAQILADWDVGGTTAFLARMNAEAVQLGMTGTTFTDPSGLAASTTSTALDLLKLGAAAMQLPDFRQIVGTTAAYVPVAGEIKNYDQLLGTDGVIGIKTGSTDAAGSCLLFAATTVVDGQTETIVGAVLGQHLGDSEGIVSPALEAAHKLVLTAEAALTTAEVAAPGATIAVFDRGTVSEGALTVAAPVTAVGWPGLILQVAVVGGTAAPAITVTAGAGTAPLAAEPLAIEVSGIRRD